MRFFFGTLITSTILGGLFLLLPVYALGQAPKIQTLADFSLKGKVKQCIVINDYGKEEFNFNENGLLVKSVTRFSENDYSVTHYKISNNIIVEKRLENYNGGVIDKGTSLAYIYRIDTTINKLITENIITYSKKILDQYIYVYDKDNQLISIKRSNDDEINETKITSLKENGELLHTYSIENIPQKTVVTKSNIDNGQDVILTKKFYQGSPQEAVEKVKDSLGRLLKKIFFVFDKDKEGLIANKSETYSYTDSTGVIDKVIYKTDESMEEKTYVYQFDGKNGNWIKQIILPDNAYITRKITYYDDPNKAFIKE